MSPVNPKWKVDLSSLPICGMEISEQAGSNPVVGYFTVPKRLGIHLRETYARVERLVACVNACSEISSADLSGAVVPAAALITANKELEKCRNALDALIRYHETRTELARGKSDPRLASALRLARVSLGQQTEPNRKQLEPA